MSRGVAALIEVIGGFFQIFGLGHIATGRVAFGLFVMLLYWLLQGINFLLMYVFVGFITWAITFVLFLIFSPLMIASPARREL